MADSSLDYAKTLRTYFDDWLETEEGKQHPFANYLSQAPDFFHLLCKLFADSDIKESEKAKLGMTIVYFVSPIDLIPEAVKGPSGYLDDIALTAYIAKNLINHGYLENVKSHWQGKGDIATIIEAILTDAGNMLGDSIWQKLKAHANNKLNLA